MRRYYEELWFVLGPDRRKIPHLLLLFLLLSSLELAGLNLIIPFLGYASGTLPSYWIVQLLPAPLATLEGIALLLLLLFVIKFSLSLLVNRRIIRFSYRFAARLRRDLMNAYLLWPYEQHLNRNSATLSQVLQADVGNVTLQTVVVWLKLLAEAVVATAIIGFLAINSLSSLLLLVCLLLGVFALYNYVFRGVALRAGKRAAEANETMVARFREGTEGLKEIRVLGVESYFSQRVDRSSTDYCDALAEAFIQASVTRPLIELALLWFIVLLVVVNSRISSAEYLLGVLAVFAVAALRLLPSIILVLNGWNEIRFSRISLTRVYQDLKMSRFSESRSSGKNITQRGIFLELKDVSFSYQNTHLKVLDRISLQLKSGEAIGFIGPSGAGKSTLVNIILGLLSPSEGSLYLNHQELADSLPAWRSRIAYIPQLIFLMDDSLRRNVALGIPDGDIDDRQVWKALEQARLADFVRTLPDALETYVGEQGTRLSGGQRQRLALARAFYHGRDILVLDEATSALDEATEAEIVQEIRQLKGQKTMIVVAHRLSTVRHCDRLYRLEKGQIVAVGTPEEILG